MFNWILLLLFVVIGIPVLAFIAIVVFSSLHLFGVISCSWWWLTIPVVFMIGGLIFDLKSEVKVGK